MDAWYGLIIAHLWLGNNEKAWVWCDQAMAFDTNHLDRFISIAFFLSNCNQENKATKLIDRASFSEVDKDKRTQKGIALCTVWLHPQAIKCFDKALELDPTLHEALLFKGIIHTDRGFYDAVYHCFDEMDLGPEKNAEAWHFLARYMQDIHWQIKAVNRALSYNKDLVRANRLKFTF